MEYNKNLKIIEELRPDLYKVISETDFDCLKKTTDKIENVSARDGSLITVVTQNEKQVRLNSAFRPLEEAKKWVQQYTFENLNNNVTMYGLGNGYFVSQLLDKMPDNDCLLIYEPCPELFMNTLEHYDLEEILKDNRVIIGIKDINEFDFHKAVREVYGIENLANNKIIVHPGYEKLFVEQLEDFKKEIRESAVSARLEYNTLRKLAKSTFHNTIVNIPKIRNSISATQLKKVWNSDIPVIIVAAGPSVEESLEDLKWAKGKAIIVAVDRITQYLLDKGVIPDFVVSLDAEKEVEYFSSGELVDIPLFCLMLTQPLIMDKQIGRKIVCWAGHYMYKHYQSALNEFPDIEISGSVATFAVSVVSYLGSKKICLVGQDLSFRGESTHAGGVVSNPDGTSGKYVEGINGEKVFSRFDWVEFKIWFEDFIVKNPDITVIDTKKSGALIKGSTLMGLREAVGNEEAPIGALIDNVNQMEATFSKEEFLHIIEQLEFHKDELVKMKKKAKEGIGYCTDLINMVKQGKAHSKSLDSKVKKVKEITDYLGNVDFYSSIDNLIIAFMKSKYIKIFSNKEDETEDLLNVYDSSRCYFEGVVETVKYIEPIMGETVKELREQEQ